MNEFRRFVTGRFVAGRLGAGRFPDVPIKHPMFFCVLYRMAGHTNIAPGLYFVLRKLLLLSPYCSILFLFPTMLPVLRNGRIIRLHKVEIHSSERKKLALIKKQPQSIQCFAKFGAQAGNDEIAVHS